MANIMISSEAPREITEYIHSRGHSVYALTGSGVLLPVRCHADMFICKLSHGRIITARRGELSPGYPTETAFNALVMGDKLFCRAASAAPRLLAAAKELGLELVPVRQGYAACSVCKVTDSAAITADEGMSTAMEQAGIDVLRIRPGGVALPGYDTGFIGGASGLIAGELIFFGDIRLHPDHAAIDAFIKAHGAEYTYIKDMPLTDLGGLVTADAPELIREKDGAFTITKLL